MGSPWDQLARSLGLLHNAPIGIRPGAEPYEGEFTALDGSQSFVVPTGSALNEPLSFVAGSVIVDNSTSCWLRVLDATMDGTGRFVPPGKGVALPILGHTSRARLDWTAPSDQVQAAFVAGEQATVIFLANPVAPGLGIDTPAATPLQVVPNKEPVYFNLAPLAAGASSTLVPAVAGKTVYLFAMNFFNAVLAGFFGDFRDSLGAQIFPWSGGSGSNYAATSGNMAAAPLPSGAGLIVKNTGSAAGQIAGAVVYSQG